MNTSAYSNAVLLTVSCVSACLCVFAAGGELPSEEVGDVATAVFEVFRASQRVGKEEARRLNAMIGPYPASVANNACAAVKRLRENCGSGLLFEAKEEEEKESSKQLNEFGSSFPFSFTSESQLVDNKTSYDSLSEDEEDLAECMVQLTDNVITQGPNRESPADTSFQDDVFPSVANGYDFKWLQHICRICCGSTCTWRELYMSVFDVLSSKLDNVGIQGEVSPVPWTLNFDLCALTIGLFMITADGSDWL